MRAGLRSATACVTPQWRLERFDGAGRDSERDADLQDEEAHRTRW
jgi:hypothetical protein